MLRERIAFLLLRSLHAACGGRKIPVSLIYFIRWLGGKELTRLPGFSRTLTWDITLIEGIMESSSIIPAKSISPWALDVKTLNFLIHYIINFKPQAILEFGSGISTICFAKIMTKIHHDPSTAVVYSIEESYSFAELVGGWLLRAHLDRFVKILCAPLTKQVIEGESIPCYYLPEEILVQFLEGVKPDLIVIDGPSGKRGARFGTLPLVKDFVRKGAVFFLDDGFRDEELRIVRKWMKIPYIKIVGFIPIGKGLVEGRIYK